MNRLKEFLRGVLPVRIWRSLHAVKTGMARLSSSTGTVIGRTLAVLLPPRGRLSLRSQLGMVRALDLDGLRIVVENEIELDMRTHPRKKEPETVEWLASTIEPGDVVFDIGANIGAYSLAAAQLGGDVVAFEPGYRTFASLCSNIVLNGYEGRITPLAVALADVDGTLVFELESSEAGGAGHPGLLAADGARDLRVCALRLDSAITSLGLPCPSHLKIDVDGAEVAVLSGASRTLRDHRLRTVLIELDDNLSHAAEIHTIFQKAGFEVVADVRHGNSPTHNAIYSRAS